MGVLLHSVWQAVKLGTGPLLPAAWGPRWGWHGADCVHWPWRGAAWWIPCEVGKGWVPHVGRTQLKRKAPPGWGSLRGGGEPGKDPKESLCSGSSGALMPQVMVVVMIVMMEMGMMEMVEMMEMMVEMVEMVEMVMIIIPTAHSC